MKPRGANLGKSRKSKGDARQANPNGCHNSPQKNLFSDNMSIPKGTSCQIPQRRTLMPNTPTSERSDLGFAKDLRF